MLVVTPAGAQSGEPPPPPAAGEKLDLSTPEPGGSKRFDARRHDDFYLRVGLGAGYAQSRYELDPGFAGYDSVDATGSGLAWELMAGGTVGHVVIGGGLWSNLMVNPSVDLGGASVETEELTLQGTLLGPFVDWYPSLRDGFHLGGALGFAELRAIDTAAAEIESSRGLGIAFWAGYDFWVGDEWSLGLGLRLTALRTGYDEDGQDATVRTRTASLMASVLFN